MSLGARATKGGAKGKERHDKPRQDKPQPKEKVKPQATTEQLRMANMIDRKADDSADVRKMVQDLMEMTCRTEEEVCSALHDSDNDVVAACNLLLETQHTATGEWQTREKKKKKPAATNNGDVEPPREPRERSGPRPRRGEGERGERGEGSGRGRGGGRGGRGAGRGGRGGGRGMRGAPRPRPDSGREWPHHPPQHSHPMGDTFPATEDWDNEEWSGSLSDTKVFTPSVNPQPAMDGDAAQQLAPASEDWDAPEPAPAAEGHIPTYTYLNPAAHHANMEQLSARVATPPAAGGAPDQRLAPDAFLQQPHNQHTPMGMSGSLSAAQSQYLSQLTQQSQRHDNSVYSTNYGVYGSTDISSQRKPQRARVPPPSKIPSSAVEMPGGAGEGGGFLDVQFGALDDLPDPPKPAPPTIHMPVGSPAGAPAAVEAPLEPPHSSPAPPPAHPPTNNMLSESLSSAEPAAPSQAAPAPEPALTNSTSALEKQLSASMKQLAVSGSDPAPMHLHMQHRHKPAAVSASSNSTAAVAGAGAGAGAGGSAASTNMYSVHPAHHPPAPVYSNVYAPPVNSSNASLSAGGALPAAYPSSVTLTQYQPIMNSYQTSSSAAAYNSSALYTAAPYTAYQPPAHAAHAPHAVHAAPQPAKHQPKDTQPQQAQYESAAVSSSLTNTSTTQTSTAKVATTTGHAAGGAGAGAGYAGGALYGSQGYAAYDEQLMRSTMPHHMGGYYEVGYGVGVGGGARDGTFGLGAGERFARSDAASPQQVPTAALPPGYAYYYQPPPPTTYQYGVYPNVSELRVQFGAGSGVGGAAAGKVPYTPQQPSYDAQDSYKPGGGYGASGTKSGGATSADLTNAMYAKTHVTLNKVNSYEKAGFHSGTPPPFGAASHLYIAAPHHHPHAPQQHQAESGSGGARGGSKQAAHNKPAYTHSYWPTN